MTNFQWQMSWRRWHLSYTRSLYSGFDFDDVYLIIGPLQMRWWS